MNTLILASGSPRRRAFLEELGIPFTVAVSRCDETLPPDLPPPEGAMAVAERKARAVADTLESNGNWVLAADTLVLVDDKVLGKPADREDAARMLRALSGRAHRVVTGVCLLSPAGPQAFFAETEVLFRPLTVAAIAWYVGTGEPTDKAGAYGIQGLGAVFVERVSGSYTNVVGLPLAKTVALLEEAGLAPWREEPEEQATSEGSP